MEVQDNKPVMTVEQLKATPEFSAITPAQRTFVLFYLETSNGRDAIRAAYPLTKKRPESYLSQLLGKTLSAPNVRAALSVYFGWSDRTKFLADLDAQLRKAKGADKVSLMALKAKLLGLVSSDIDCGILTTPPANSNREQKPQVEPISAARGDIHAEVAPKPVYDEMSRRIFHHD